MNNLIVRPAWPQTVPSPQFPFINLDDIPEATIVDYTPVETPSNIHFLEANTDSITMDALTSDCIVPTWGNQELTISHQDFINTVYDAAKNYFCGESVNAPAIRVSHEVKGRIPAALYKKPSELLPSDKTKFFQRLAFAFTIPTIFESIDGQRMELCIGGVRNYNDLNLYRASRSFEKFSVFIGWRVNICSNQILTGDGLKFQMEVSNLDELYLQCIDLFRAYAPSRDIHLMKSLTDTYLTESQFATIVGRCRLYQALPPKEQRAIPRLLITDSQINSCCRGYFANPDFGAKDNQISLWDFHNLLTESNKSSYIDSYLQRAVNATELSVGINNMLHGVSDKYAWFLS